MFQQDRDNRLSLTGHNECFFRAAPLKGMDDALCFPALLNCSKFESPDGKPLSWICTANHDLSAGEVSDETARMWKQFGLLLQCLLETGFNLSSEAHEGASWYAESVRVDNRIATVERWEKATAANPLFVLDVPWLSTHMTVRQVQDRIFANHAVPRHRMETAMDLARVLFNFGRTRPAETE